MNDKSGQKSSGGNRGKRRNSNNNKRRSNNRRRSGRGPRNAAGPVKEDQVVKKYQNLLEQHLLARRKYFELYFRADPNQKRKLENNFYKTIEQLREFEDGLNGPQKTALESLTEGFKKDYTYAHNHELPVETPEGHDPGEIDDPHYLETQKSADYGDDTEESSGSMEDYYNYKGIKPEPKEEIPR